MDLTTAILMDEWLTCRLLSLCCPPVIFVNPKNSISFQFPETLLTTSRKKMDWVFFLSHFQKSEEKESCFGVKYHWVSNNMDLTTASF
eukprot:UN11896